MHIQGFMAFKYCSLDPVIFHLHCNVEQAKGYGNECDWPFNCLTYIKIEAFSCFLTYPAHLKENDRKSGQRLPSRSQSGFPVLCSRRAVLGQQSCRLSRDSRPSLWSWDRVPSVGHSLLTWLPLTCFPIALPASSHRVPNLHPISSVPFKHYCWSDLYGLQRDLEKLFNLRVCLQRESKTNIPERKEL